LNAGKVKLDGDKVVEFPRLPEMQQVTLKVLRWEERDAHLAVHIVNVGLLASDKRGLTIFRTGDKSESAMRSSKAGILTATAFFNLFMLLNPALAQTWTASTNAPNQEWWAVASSADGEKLVAAIYGGGIYTSTNAGQTWISNNVPKRQWYSVASSADGTKLVAVVNIISTSGNGGVYVSTNSGVSWTLTSAPAYFQFWDSVACSSDGRKLIGCGEYVFTYQIYTSGDSGNTWTLTSAPNLSWYSVASSSDGTKLVAVAYQTNVIYTSTDSGTTWSPNAVPTNGWYCVASSADGTKLAAGAVGGPTLHGAIYTSTNSGLSWISNNVANQSCYSVASSEDGTKLVAALPPSIYTSADSGKTWISNNVPGYTWVSVACSADGSRLVAVAASGQVYTYANQPVSPSLNVTQSGANLTLSWPASGTAFQLQQNSDLGTSGWSNALNTVVVTNGQNQVFIAPTNSRTFYRLKSQ